MATVSITPTIYGNCHTPTAKCSEPIHLCCLQFTIILTLSTCVSPIIHPHMSIRCDYLASEMMPTIVYYPHQVKVHFPLRCRNTDVLTQFGIVCLEYIECHEVGCVKNFVFPYHSSMAKSTSVWQLVLETSFEPLSHSSCLWSTPISYSVIPQLQVQFPQHGVQLCLMMDNMAWWAPIYPLKDIAAAG